MSTRTAIEEQVATEVKRLCYLGLDSPTLRREVARCLQRAVPSDGYCIFETDPASGLITRMTCEPTDERRGQLFLEQIYVESDLNQQLWMARNGQPVVRLSDVTGGRLEHDLKYREVYAPWGMGFDLRSVFTRGRELWGGLTLWRERGRSDFAEREVALIGRLAPHLGLGLQAALLRAQAPLEVTVESGPGVLILNDRSEVVQYTPLAERWLRELADLGPGWREGRNLPEAIWAVVGALRHSLRPERERDRECLPCVRVRARSGIWLKLQASSTESSAGRAGELVIVIEPAGPRELSWLRTAAYQLSPREQEVVDLIVRGASTKEIAAALVISEYTVQDHLSHIFEKVGVRSRRALVKQLYLESLPLP